MLLPLLLAASLPAALLHGAEVRVSADRVHVRPGERLKMALHMEGPETVSSLHWAVTSGSPVWSSDPAAGAGSSKKVRCGPRGCLVYSDGREPLAQGFAVWEVAIPHAARRGPVELKLECLSAASPDGSLVATVSPAPVRVEVTEDGRPYFEALGVVNAASGRPALSPGGLASIYGLGFSTASGMESAGGVREFRGFSVLVNGVAAPVLALGRAGEIEQANIQIPFETLPGAAEIEVRNGEMNWRVGGIRIAPVSPGIFEADGRAAALHPDGSPVNDRHPARAGEVVAVYLTGCGALAGSVPTGEPGPTPPMRLASAAQATIGGLAGRVDFAGYAPGLLGVCQMNIEIPPLMPGDAILLITVGGASSNAVRLPVS